MRTLLATIGISAVLSGCGGEGEPTTVEPKSPRELTSSTPDSPTTYDLPDERYVPSYLVGETMFSVEIEMTVHKVEGVDLGDSGNPGFREVVEAYVETCTPNGAPAWDMSVFDFVAVTDSDRVIPVGTLLSGVREPAYPTFGVLRSGRCQEGWVQIGMDSGDVRTVVAVEFAPGGGDSVAAWPLKHSLKLGQPDF